MPGRPAATATREVIAGAGSLAPRLRAVLQPPLPPSRPDGSAGLPRRQPRQEQCGSKEQQAHPAQGGNGDARSV